MLFGVCHPEGDKSKGGFHALQGAVIIFSLGKETESSGKHSFTCQGSAFGDVYMLTGSFEDPTFQFFPQSYQFLGLTFSTH